jgi:hemerythrin-like domain-containing protein
MKTFSKDNEPISIFSCLKEDHKEIKRLCRAITSESSGATATAKSKFEQLRLLLSSHAKAEEKIFYTILKSRAEAAKKSELKDIVLEGYEEHHVADHLLHELERMDPANERWMAKMTVLSEVLDHHIEEEEEDMFSDAREELESSEIRSLGAEFLNKQTSIAERLR